MSEKRKKASSVILILGGIAAIGPFAIDMYLPGFTAIARDLSTDIATVGYSLTSYFLGICFGQLFYGPVLDRFGRKKPLLCGLALFTAASAGCALSPTITAFISLRTVQALGGCVGMVAGRAVIRDVFPVRITARVFSALMLVMGAAPIIAPTAGGIVADLSGWRTIFWFLAAFGASMFMSVYFRLPESRPPDPEVSLAPGRVLSNYLAVASNHEFLIYALASGFLGSSFFAYINGSAFIYMDLFGMTEKNFGVVYAVNAFALIGASQLNRLLLKKWPGAGVSLVAAAAQLSICLSLAASAPWAVEYKAAFGSMIFLFLATCGILNPNMTALAMKPLERSAGSASALLGFVQMFLGTLSSSLVSYFHDGTAFPMAAVMLSYSFAGLVFILMGRNAAARKY